MEVPLQARRNRDRAPRARTCRSAPGRTGPYTCDMAASVRFALSRDLDAIEYSIERIENAADRLFIDKLRPDDWAAAPRGVARASEPGFILVVELDGGHVAGFVHVLEVDGICHLEQLSVAPGDARKGWGRTLVEAAKNQAQKRGYPSASS